MSQPSTPAVHAAGEHDRQVMATVLADAFTDDPVFSFMFPPGTPGRSSRMTRMFAIDVERSQKLGGAWLSDDSAGAAVWYPPGRWEPSTLEMLLQTPRWLAVFGKRLPFATRVLTALQQHHRTLEPHWYLYYLGTKDGRRSAGVGSALLRQVLQRCDRERTPAYLEASNTRNRELYLRHGFEPLKEIQLPNGGPTMFPMWRPPG